MYVFVRFSAPAQDEVDSKWNEVEQNSQLVEKK